MRILERRRASWTSGAAGEFTTAQAAATAVGVAKKRGGEGRLGVASPNAATRDAAPFCVAALLCGFARTFPSGRVGRRSREAPLRPSVQRLWSLRLLLSSLSSARPGDGGDRPDGRRTVPGDVDAGSGRDGSLPLGGWKRHPWGVLVRALCGAARGRPRLLRSCEPGAPANSHSPAAACGRGPSAVRALGLPSIVALSASRWGFRLALGASPRAARWAFRALGSSRPCAPSPPVPVPSKDSHLRWAAASRRPFSPRPLPCCSRSPSLFVCVLR